MRGNIIRGAVVSAAAATLLAPVVALADQTIQAAPPSRFATTTITMDQGERLVFHNGDTVSHDVTATAATADGKPLFRTGTTAAGKDAFVEGSQYLTEGHYDFICSIHPNMKGSIHVTGNGTAQPRPGAATPTDPDTGRPADRVKPTLALTILSRTTKATWARRSLTVRFKVDEPSHVELRAVARPKAGGPLVTVARRTWHRISGVRRVRLTLTAAGREALRRNPSLAVIVKGIAIDRSGNMTRADRGRTLTP